MPCISETDEIEQACFDMSATVRAVNAVTKHKLTLAMIPLGGGRLHIPGVGVKTEPELREAARRVIEARGAARLDRACKTPWFEFCL